MTASFRVISIGALAANPLWGERGNVRPAHATTTLIQADGATILVDPSLPPQVLAARMAERTDVTPEQVTHVFLTCLHPLHRRGIKAFEKAQWLVAQAEREAIGVSMIQQFHEARDAGDAEVQRLLLEEIAVIERCQAAADSLAEGVDLFPLPGVTPGLCGLLLELGSTTVLVAGDAVASQDHLERGQVISPCHDLQKARESLAEAIEIADLIVAGRDNLLLNLTRRPF